MCCQKPWMLDVDPSQKTPGEDATRFLPFFFLQRKFLSRFVSSFKAPQEWQISCETKPRAFQLSRLHWTSPSKTTWFCRTIGGSQWSSKKFTRTNKLRLGSILTDLLVNLLIVSTWNRSFLEHIHTSRRSRDSKRAKISPTNCHNFPNRFACYRC